MNTKYQFKTEPWAHQLAALKASWDKPYFALVCEYGTGKTKIIIDNAGILFEQGKLSALFVVAPNEVHERWVSEQLPLHLPDHIRYIARVWSGSTSKKYKESLEELWLAKNKDKLKVLAMNIEALQSSPRAQALSKNFLNDFEVMLVVDESTRIKSVSAKRTKFLVNHLSKLAEYRRTLTGNEVTRSPFDLYAPYEFLAHGFWRPISSYHVFKHRYGEWKTGFTYRKSINLKTPIACQGGCKRKIYAVEVKRSAAGLSATCPSCGFVVRNPESQVQRVLDSGGKFEYPQLIGYKNLEELRTKVSEHSFLIKKEDCMDLPPKVYQPIYTTLNSEQARVYRELKTTMITEYKDIELTVQNKIALSVRFQQVVGGFFPESGERIGDNNPKIDRLMYDLEDVDTGSPIIVWARFVRELEEIARMLRKNYDRPVALYYGATPKDERKIIIDKLQHGEYGFFVANPETAGTGLNLQIACLHYYYSNSFRAEDRWQSEDRSHRGGQTKTCTYRDIYIKGTIDDTIKKANDEKKNLADFFKQNRMEALI